MIAVKSFPNLPDLDIKEVLRYAGIKQNSSDAEEYAKAVDSYYQKIKDGLTPAVCYSEFDIKRNGDKINLGFAETSSKDIQKNLEGCEKLILFVATIGFAPDIEIKKNRLKPSVALYYQAIGAERTEALCNSFCDYLKNEEKSGYILRPRFSPGYGDLPLDIQKDIFSSLNCEKNIGVTLNQSLLMSPTKSVSAIIGLKSKEK